jgi:hypothetical protein
LYRLRHVQNTCCRSYRPEAAFASWIRCDECPPEHGERKFMYVFCWRHPQRGRSRLQGFSRPIPDGCGWNCP